MKLYMRQHVFTIGDSFNVWDEDGHDRWFVEQELLTWGKILRVYDLSGREAASIHQEVLTFRPRFTVTIGGQECAQVVQHFTLFVQEYTVEGPDWHIEGEFLAHEFTAWDGERRALSIEKEWLTWGDCYTLDIPEPRDELLALAVVLAIDSANQR